MLACDKDFIWKSFSLTNYIFEAFENVSIYKLLSFKMNILKTLLFKFIFSLDLFLTFILFFKYFNSENSDFIFLTFFKIYTFLKIYTFFNLRFKFILFWKEIKKKSSVRILWLKKVTLKNAYQTVSIYQFSCQ